MAGGIERPRMARTRSMGVDLRDSWAIEINGGERGRCGLSVSGMMTTVSDFVSRLLGLDVPGSELTFSHMAWRSLVVFCFAVALARWSDRRSLGRNAGFDVMLGVILGSVLSRGVNGQSPFFPTLGASAVLVLLHRLVGTACYRWHRVSVLVKGRARVLIRNGRMDEAEMRSCKITTDDLDENLRINGNEPLGGAVQEARLERNGSISVVKKKESTTG